MNILITVDKFGSAAKDQLSEYIHKHNVVYNTLGRKLAVDELCDLLKKVNPHIIIAGTEAYTKDVLDLCGNLVAISRVGIGVDAIDLLECERRGIAVYNTPDAPTNAVVDLTIGQIYNTTRRIQESDQSIRSGNWIRYVGKDLSDSVIGIIGHGRIGSLLAKRIKPLVKKVYVTDLDVDKLNNTVGDVANLDTILRACDIITLHIPLTVDNKHFISYEQLEKAKKSAIFINTSRGGIIDEQALCSWLQQNSQAIAAIDVFEKEPYTGILSQLPNCYLTAHIGSCTHLARYEMELGSVNNIKDIL